jgi:bis(5'-nucleosidyl)-tetraphosphatase
LLHYAAGHWDFPKGHLEQGETKEQAAHRELKEETGLTAAITPEFQDLISYFFINHHKNKAHKTVTFFTGETTTKEVTFSDEHQGYQWLPYEPALQKLTYDNAKEVLKKVNRFLHS